MMSGMRANDTKRNGTRFKLWPQPPFLAGMVPETVWVSSPAGSIGPGPADRRMFVIDPIGDKPPYGIAYGPYGTPFLYLPPWTGPVAPPVPPDQDGNFDYLEPDQPGFEAAHVFGCIRFVLDVWEAYFGRRIPWHFEPDYRRLEIVLLPNYDNAQAGYGFLEVGSYFIEGRPLPFTINFDIVAHEVGHLIISSEVGTPTPATASAEYLGFQEGAADITALVAAANFDSVIDQLLEQTAGNLRVLNRLNRIGELSDHRQIRLASNNVHLSAFAAGWTDEHALSLPFTGAIFDILLDIFHELLVDRRLISPELEDLADVVEQRPEYEPMVQSLFNRTYDSNPGGFRSALLAARDLVGTYLAETWTRLPPERLHYAGVARTLLEVDRDLSRGRYRRLIDRNFALRGIGSVIVGPRLEPPSSDSHAFSARTLLPEDAARLPRMRYRERWLLAQRLA
jgi:hypothetical protein